MAARVEQAFKAAVADKKLPAVGAVALDRSGDVIFKGAYGVTNLDDSNAAPFTTSTQMMIFSCTKMVTSVAALQLIEQGKLNLDDPVEKYVPEIAKIQVLEGFNDDGSPKLRPAKTKPNVLNLFTHTSGLTYDFFDPETLKWRVAVGQQPVGYVAISQMSDFTSPYAFDPSSAYSYGTNTDFLGMIVEKISGLRLDEYIDKNILQPLGMKNSGRLPKPGAQTLLVHFKGEDGSLVAHPEVKSPDGIPEVVGGGHFLYSTLDDYSTFLLALLNNGKHPQSGAKILEEKTVKDYVFKDFIPQACGSNAGVGTVPTSIPQISNVGEFLPGIAKGWSCGLMMNNEDFPNGRAAGSGGWAGLGNLYYWIDPTKGKLGLIASAVFPFFDTEVMHLFDELERVVYGKDPAKSKGEKGSSYVIHSAIEVAG